MLTRVLIVGVESVDKVCNEGEGTIDSVMRVR